MKERNEEKGRGDTASRNGKYRRALPAYGLISRACSRFSYFVFSFAEYGMRFKERTSAAASPERSFDALGRARFKLARTDVIGQRRASIEYFGNSRERLAISRDTEPAWRQIEKGEAREVARV